MNESAEYTRLLAQAYSKLADDYSAMLKREDAARAEIESLVEVAEKWAIDARNASERADAAEARVKELEEDNARYAFCVTHLKRELANALEQGGAK